MKFIRPYFVLILLCFSNANAFVCVDSYVLNIYEMQAKQKYEQGDNNIASVIDELTNIIKNEINKTEENNKNIYKGIERAKEAQSLIALKKSFLLKQNNELQSIANDVKAQ